MTDPIDRPDFNRNNKREPNHETMERLRLLADNWRAATRLVNDRRAKLNAILIRAYDTGHSYSHMREATGLSTGAIQMVLAKAGRLSSTRD